ncbi:hypothetical protein [Mesorhizobium sp. NZP2077]|uniref:hypothetical protein n=1 Tax=Mesorhizobium sp. NZP2077 TaxID=2483404 RepID=UPI001551CBEB|nr:hypothetical protein [Mesorhizobium sp. NZP2077]QKC84390.1 hypothetical protein EB232_24850 [Mesorhizobium sp. NZP2077]QKD17950.1 hypothetical protein HGP13_24550 [Mesorhizobium sp. NZP2077]
MLSKLRSFIIGTRDGAKVAADEFATVEAAYAEAALEVEGLAGKKLALDMKPEAKQPGETREEHASRLWELQTERKALAGKIEGASAALKELSTKRTKLRNDREQAQRTATLAEGSQDGAEAIAAVKAAKVLVTDIEAKRTAATQHSEALATERSAIALQAHSGDDAARRRLDELHGEIGTQNSERASLDSALAEAQQRLKDAEAVLAGQDRAYRQSEAARISALLLEQSAIADTALAAAAAALHRRRDLATELRKTGIISSSMTNQLGSPMTMNRALAAAGLGDFARFDRGGHATPLADHDVKIVGRPTGSAQAAA